MCGRYASVRKRIELLEEFSVQRDKVAEPLAPDYNVAPTKPVYAVLTRAPRDDQDDPGREAAQAAGPDGPDGRGGPDGPDGPDGAQEAPAAAERQLRVVRW